MSRDAEIVLDRVRAIALALPGGAEKISHGAPMFFIEKGRGFAWFCHNHHGDGHLAVLVKTSGLEEQEMLIDLDPDLYFKPPYLGPSGWIGMELNPETADWDHVASWIEKSWRAVAPRKLLESFDG